MRYSDLKKYFIYLLIFLMVLGSAVFFARIFGYWKLYTQITTSNDPGIPPGTTLLVVQTGNPEPKEFLVFKHLNDDGSYTPYVFRVVGNPGDTVEIRNGVVYRNGKNFDEDLTLKFSYSVPKKSNPRRRLEKLGISEQDLMLSSWDSYVDAEEWLIFATTEMAEKLQGASKRQFPEGENDQFLSATFNPDNNANYDWIGPFVVPHEKYFVMGDNRHNAADSRSWGYIPEKDILGIVVARF